MHDEEAEVSIGLATLIANSQRNRSAAGQMPLNNPEFLPGANGDASEGQDAPPAAESGRYLLHACMFSVTADLCSTTICAMQD